MSDKEQRPHDALVIGELLRELDELRELDRRRNAHAPGSAAHDAATLEVDLRTRRVMDRFRDLKERRSPPMDGTEEAWMRPVDARERLHQERGSLLN